MSDTNEPKEPSITQADIEDVAVYAAQRGLTVLALGMTKEQMAQYNRLCFAEQRIVLSAELTKPPEEEQLTFRVTKPKNRSSTAVHLVCID